MELAALVAPAKPGSLASLGMTTFWEVGMTTFFELGMTVEGRMAKQELLAAKAPSPSIAGGSWAGGIGVQVWPSVVKKSSNFNWPLSSGMGSPRTMPWVGSQKSMESKNPLGFLLVNWSRQDLPASVVW